MEEKDKLVEQTVARLKSIQTMDEFKTAKDEILDLMEEIFKTGLDALKAFFEDMFSLTPEEKQKESLKFQDETYLLDPKIMEEMERLDEIPGSEEFGDEFEAEMEKRLGPYLEQYSEELGKLMDSFMGGMVEGMAEALKPEEEEEEEEEILFDYGNPYTPKMLYHLYMSRTLEELVENKDMLIESLEEQMQSDIWDLEILTDTEFMPKLEEEDQKKIEDILHRMRRFKPEMEKEFARLAALPDAAETAGTIQKEIMDKLNPKAREVKRHLAKPWKR